MRVATILFAGLLHIAKPALAAEIIGKASRIVDGDTFYIDKIAIRLCGIDAPEQKMKGYLEAQKALAKITGSKTVRCVPVGEGTVCDGRSPKKSHNRIVAQCSTGNQDIAAILVRQGFACDWVKFSGRAYPGGCSK